MRWLLCAGSRADEGFGHEIRKSKFEKLSYPPSQKATATQATSRAWAQMQHLGCPGENRNKKPANGTGRPRALEKSSRQPLAGGECSRRGDQTAASTRDERIKNALSPGGHRKPNQPSGQVAAPTQRTARVGFEFARRAHRREFTPKLEIKRKENFVKEKEEEFEKKMKGR